jgi:hypothetical protein
MDDDPGTPRGKGKGVVFDFDHTLTTQHFYGLMTELDDPNYLPKNRPHWINLSRNQRFEHKELIEWVFGADNPDGVDPANDRERLLKIVDLLVGLKEVGCMLYISTAGSVSFVITVLHALNEWGFNISPLTFENIHGRESSTSRNFVVYDPFKSQWDVGPPTKTQFVTSLVRGNVHEAVAFIDDQHTDYDVLRYVSGVTVIDIPYGNNGMTSNNMEVLLKWAVDDTVNAIVSRVIECVFDRTACHACKRTDIPLKCCSNCKVAVYCSSNCAEADWERAHIFYCDHVAKFCKNKLPLFL